jgi:tetratricopeptide (TPR) repeat protein
MNARSELDSARPVLAQLDVSRGPEKAKADLLTVWSAAEAALRSLVGGSTATGQQLVRDARSRQLLSFDQANALVAFDAVREQLGRPDYVPTETDANTARNAFLKLDAGLMTAPAPQAPYMAAGATPAQTAAAQAPAPTASVEPLVRSRRPIWIPILVAVLVVAGIGAALLFRPRGSSSAVLDEGIRAYTANDRATAAMKFEQAARQMPNSALPHVYLSRMAREVGNYTVANQELQLALKVEPGSLEGRREYGSLFLAQGNFDMARSFYVRALEVNAGDKASQGWLGCALVRLNRVQEGLQWLNRAGSGPWSSCATLPPPATPGVVPP